MRPENWPAMLDVYLAGAMQKSFTWGSLDCVMFACDWYLQMTGRDPAAPFRGRYTTEAAAKRIMVANGVHDMRQAGRFLFGDPMPFVTFAQCGDIVLAAGALGINLGAKGAFLTETAVQLIAAKHFDFAWKV